MSELLNIEVAYALPERQTVLCIRVSPETSVLAAIEQSGICLLYTSDAADE